MARRIKDAAWFVSRYAILLGLIALCGSARISAQKEQKISGLSLILKAESVEGGETLFHADGYRIRITSPGTDTSFAGSPKSLGDVTPGTWIAFEGVRDDTGILVARKAAFFPPGTRKGLTKMGPSKGKAAPEYQPVTDDRILDAKGQLVSPSTPIPRADADALCAWYGVPGAVSLQNHVQQIGMRLVPEYQKQLPPDAPSRIAFRFYVVSDAKVASALDCQPGVVLLPAPFLDRLHNEAQIAAVLADGVALHLMRQLGGFSQPEGIGTGTLVAAGMAAAAAPWVGAGPFGIVANHSVTVQIERQRARIALQLMDDAGFDPWQAPEAWRLLAPNKPPRDLSSLKDTSESKYQLSILEAQYKRTGGAAGSDAAKSH